MQREPFLARALWPLLLLSVIAFAVVDLVQHPFLGGSSEAAVVPPPHLTLWLAQTEASGEAGELVRESADSLALYGQPATVGLLGGGAAQAVSDFFAGPRSADDLLAVSSETLADLSQERASTLVGEEPLAAARAQRLLARAVPLGLLGGAPLTLAVLRDSLLRDAAELVGQLRRSPRAHVFATADDNWDTDNLAALVQQAGVDGVVPYSVFSSTRDASLALTAGSADVVLGSREELLPDIRAGRLRELRWPASAGAPPRLWVELLAAPGTNRVQVAALRRLLRHLAHNRVWLDLTGARASVPLDGASLGDFLSSQLARVTALQRLARRVESH